MVLECTMCFEPSLRLYPTLDGVYKDICKQCLDKYTASEKEMSSSSFGAQIAELKRRIRVQDRKISSMQSELSKIKGRK